MESAQQHSLLSGSKKIVLLVALQCCAVCIYIRGTSLDFYLERIGCPNSRLIEIDER